MLRLTLRTLLAYLDDTLEPAQARAIGQKVAESESARELMERIKQVTRRRRLTTPPASGPGSNIDPNTVAEYLDNEVTPEQAAEVEQICLSSDVHLAEVAACHQILTLILGEPVRPPATALQRMYGLVKGPGAIPFRRPAEVRPKSAAEPYAESKDIDETLRLGVPALRRHQGWRSPLILIGGGVLAAALLVLAIVNVLTLPGPGDNLSKNNAVAQADKANGDKGQSSSETDKAQQQTRPATDKNGSESKGSTDEKKTVANASGSDKKTEGTETPVPVQPVAMDVPFGPPNMREAPVGHYVPDAKESSILLQAVPNAKFPWKRVTAKQPEVYSARPLLSLPGSRSTVDTNRGVRVLLWGNMPEFIATIPVFESLVELYTHDTLDLDLLLHRGRVVLTSTRADKPVSVRLRFENPLIPSTKDLAQRQEYFDIQLPQKGSSVLIDRWNNPPMEPFFKDPKSPSRLGPTADMGFLVLEGSAVVKYGDETHAMTAPPGPALFLWNSLKGRQPPAYLKKIPEVVLGQGPSAVANADAYKAMVAARNNLATLLASTNLDVGLAQSLASPNVATQRLVVRCLAAVSDLPSLLEALDQTRSAELRVRAIEALRSWTAASRDNDYKVFNLLKEKYKGREAEIIMELLHSFSEAERQRPERYELLIDYLVNRNLVIRELAAWHLYQLVPVARRTINYAADADFTVRENAVAEWRRLIPPGQLPLTTMPAPGPKKK